MFQVIVQRTVIKTGGGGAGGKGTVVNVLPRDDRFSDFAG